MNITVLGGSGFIGTHLISALQAAGHAVRNLDKAPSTRHPELSTLADVRDVEALQRLLRGSECVINLAAEHGDQVRPVRLYTEVNVGGAANLVAALTAHGCKRLIYLSSAAVYGRQPCADERSPVQPDHPYGASKWQAEQIYQRWAQADGTRALSVIRPSVVFGEGHRGNVRTLIEHLRDDRFVMVGRGQHRKSIAYVGNLVDFLLTRLDDAPGVHVRNYADAPALSTADLVARLRRLLALPPSRVPALPYPLARALLAPLDLYAALRGRAFGISGARIEKFCRESRLESVHPHPPARVSLDEALARTVAEATAPR